MVTSKISCQFMQNYRSLVSQMKEILGKFYEFAEFNTIDKNYDPSNPQAILLKKGIFINYLSVSYHTTPQYRFMLMGIDFVNETRDSYKIPLSSMLKQSDFEIFIKNLASCINNLATYRINTFNLEK